MNKVDEFWTETTVPFNDFKTIEESIEFEKWRCSIYPKYYELMDYYKQHNGQIILDYGCGVGNDIIRFNNLSDVKKTYGIDISEKALTQSAKRIKLHKYNNIELIKLESDKVFILPIESNSIDYIHSGGVLHHTTNMDKRLLEFSRILKDNGTGNIMVYNRNSIWFHLYLAFYLIDKEKKYEGTPDENFVKTTDGENCPVSKCFKPEEFIKTCNDANLNCEYMGGYLSEMEMNFLKQYYKEALTSETLPKESKEFLKALTFDSDGLPMYNGKYAGIGGSYRISKKNYFKELGFSLNLTSLVLEITNVCNLKCPMCIKQSDWYKKYDKTVPKIMGFENFKKIIDEYEKYELNDFSVNNKSVILQFQGESLTMPDFIKYCEYVESKKIKFGFTTNGCYLTKDITDKLLTFEYFSSIAFSVDGINKKMYESIRINAKFDTVFSNINYFINQWHNKKIEHRLGVHVNAVIMSENENEIYEIVKYFIKRGTTVSAAYVTDNNAIPIKYNFIEERKPCSTIFSSMIILTSGKAVACCRDNKYILGLGNVFKESLYQVWNGVNYNALRKIHLAKKWDAIPPCNNCLTWTCGTIPEKETGISEGIKKYTGTFWFKYVKADE